MVKYNDYEDIFVIIEEGFVNKRQGRRKGWKNKGNYFIAYRPRTIQRDSMSGIEAKTLKDLGFELAAIPRFIQTFLAANR